METLGFKLPPILFLLDPQLLFGLPIVCMVAVGACLGAGMNPAVATGLYAASE